LNTKNNPKKEAQALPTLEAEIVTLMFHSIESLHAVPESQDLASTPQTQTPTTEVKQRRSLPISGFSKREHLIMALKGKILAPGAPFDPEEIPVMSDLMPRSEGGSWSVLRPKSKNV